MPRVVRRAHPPIGIGEASFHIASLVSRKCGAVTTSARSIPAIVQSLVKYGLYRRCTSVRASEVVVLDLELFGSDACVTISSETSQSIAKDVVEAVILGCRGMTDLAQKLSAEHNAPVLEGVSCSVSFAEALVGLGILGFDAQPSCQFAAGS